MSSIHKISRFIKLVTAALLLSSFSYLRASIIPFQYPCGESTLIPKDFFLKPISLEQSISESGITPEEKTIIQSNFLAMTYYDFILNQTQFDTTEYFTLGLNDVIYPVSNSLSYEPAYNQFNGNWAEGVLTFLDRLFASNKKFIFFVPPQIHAYWTSWTNREFLTIMSKSSSLLGRGIFVFGAYDFFEKKPENQGFLEKFKIHQLAVDFVIHP